MKQTSAKQIAKQRIQILFEQAKQVRKTQPKLAMQYVESARKIAMATKLSLPIELKLETCRKCNALLVLGYNSRVRIRQKREPHIVKTCLSCGNQTRRLLRDYKEKKKVEQNNYANEASR